jgi:hypothetical protein
MRGWCLAVFVSGLCLSAVTARGAPDAVAAASTYADSLLRYDPSYGGGCVPTNPNFMDPAAVLGAPNYSGGSNGTGSVALGRGGMIEIGFVASQISNSGDPRADLQIVEVGGFAEAFDLALRPCAPTTPEELAGLGLRDLDQDGFFEIGAISGGLSDVDLDALLAHSVPELGLRFDAVQIVDDYGDHPTCTSTPGADIDAVIALHAHVAIAPSTWGAVKSIFRE